MEIKLVLWGIGKIYNSMLNLLKFYTSANQLSVIGITAGSLPDCSTLDGWNLISTKDLSTVNYDYLMVMSDDYFEEIVNTATDMVGVPRDKIVSYHILEIPYFNFQEYDLLKRSRVSIVSNNCWGGMVYNTLGMECLSPFKNISFSARDYIRLLGNLEHYLSIDPVWRGKTEMDINQNREVPLLELDDIFIKCNHDPNAEIAISNWKRRRDKFNWNNIFVEMYTEKPEVEEEFGEVSGQYHHRICFVPYEPHEEYSMQLPMMPGQAKFYETVNGAAGTGKNGLVYDILQILNTNKKYRII